MRRSPLERRSGRPQQSALRGSRGTFRRRDSRRSPHHQSSGLSPRSPRGFPRALAAAEAAGEAWLPQAAPAASKPREEVRAPDRVRTSPTAGLSRLGACARCAQAWEREAARWEPAPRLELPAPCAPPSCPLHASRQACPSSGTSPDRVASPSFTATSTLAAFTCGSENILALISLARV